MTDCPLGGACPLADVPEHAQVQDHDKLATQLIQSGFIEAVEADASATDNAEGERLSAMYVDVAGAAIRRYWEQVEPKDVLDDLEMLEDIWTPARLRELRQGLSILEDTHPMSQSQPEDYPGATEIARKDALDDPNGS